MSWQHHLRNLLVAGGALTLGGCPAPFCGNANPDPCICGRDDTTPEKHECAERNICEDQGGVWSDPENLYADGEQSTAPVCGFGVDAAIVYDASPPPDATIVVDAGALDAAPH